MTGERFPSEGREYQEFVLILGGQSGKTRLTAAIMVYETCGTDWSKFMAPGELAWAFVFATREEQAADIGKNMIFSMIQTSPLLRDLVEDDPDQAARRFFPKTKATVMVLKTGVAIRAMPCSGRVGRGYPTMGCILDEAAHYRVETKRMISDQSIYDSILPRMIKFEGRAKMGIITTPTDDSGLVYARWRERERKKDLYLCVQAPTWKIRTDYSKVFFERAQRMLSPEVYAQEYGAQFQRSRRRLVPKEEVVRACRETDALIPYQKDYVYAMAFDAAFGDNDRFGVAVGHREDAPDGERFKIIVDVAQVVVPPPDQDMVDAAADRVAELYHAYQIFEVWCDRYQADAFGKILEARGCSVQIHETTAGTHRIKYNRLRYLLHHRMVELPPDEELQTELCGLEWVFLPRSRQYTVQHVEGGHDDVADAVAEVVFHLTDDLEAGGGGIHFLGQQTVSGEGAMKISLP